MTRTEHRDAEGDTIPVIEYIRPNGHKEERAVDHADADVVAKAQQIIEAGFNFNLEYLGSAYSMCISNEYFDATQQIVFSNGNEKLFDMIRTFDIEDAIQRSKEYAE